MKALFKEGARETGVASLSHMLFIFDCRDHFLAVEEAGASLPVNADFIPILNDYLTPLAKQLFPEHDLHILLIADRKSLEGVLSSAAAFSHIEVELTFPNGVAENSLEELKRARIQKLKLSGSPGVDGKISNELPSFMLDLIKGGIKFGRTKLSYFTKAEHGGGAREVYDSDTMPLKFEKRRNAADTDASFVQRCVEDLRLAIGEIISPLPGSSDKG
ncbi:hypothetical protein ACZ75_06630 [Massilia sp. NR 4-1]|nr:hypothetical protein ACZ75_06630 [Massilia sp. NR 4-1]